MPRPTHPVLGFQYRHEAERFLQELKERMTKFGLELHPVKTPLIEFGRFAAERRKQRGENGRPETFNFLGLTIFAGQTERRAISPSSDRRSANVEQRS